MKLTQDKFKKQVLDRLVKEGAVIKPEAKMLKAPRENPTIVEATDIYRERANTQSDEQKEILLTKLKKTLYIYCSEVIDNQFFFEDEEDDKIDSSRVDHYLFKLRSQLSSFFS